MSNRTFAENIIAFYRELDLNISLPHGIRIMNPYRENPDVIPAITKFYNKYYCDTKSRHIIIGINPGRFGAGITGIPFTDTIRLWGNCGIKIEGLKSFETSSVFVYEVIESYGGPEKFYGDFYITSASPLGFTSKSSAGKELNYNYYDSKELTEAVSGFAVDSLLRQISFGIKTDVGFCLGTGKNYKFLKDLNSRHRFFDHIEPLEHPRFIMQYRSKEKHRYIESYIRKLKPLR